MRIAVIHVGQETNDFNPAKTTLRDFRAFGLLEGAEIAADRTGIGPFLGHLDAVAETGMAIDTVPIIHAWAGAGGRIDREAFDFFADRIRTGLRAAGSIDGLMMQLHGACAAEGGIDDVEGEQVALCREILGKELPIVLALDHHANITEKLATSATAIVGHRTQPHDPYNTGLLASRLMIRILRGEVRPVIAWRKLRLITHQEQFLTDRGPMQAWFERGRAMERADPRILEVSPFPMQPWLDVAEGGWAVTVTADGDRDLAERYADEMAELAWSMRKEFMRREAVAVDEAVRLAEAEPRGVVVLSDTGDTVFGGAAGDSNLILESMLRQRIGGPALLPLIAPATAIRLAEAGEGAELTLPVGGETTPFFTPLTVSGRVRRVGGGRIRLNDKRHPEVDMGRTAVFQVGPVTMLVSELRGVAGNLPEAYRAFGIEPRDYKMAVLKTASNFQYFAPITSRLIRVDTRGPGQSDVMGLPWKRIPRPIYPLDRVDSWRG